MTRSLLLPALILAVAAQAPAQSRSSAPAATAGAAGAAAPLVFGETFTIASKTLGEVRRINVYLPPGYAESPTTRLPVLYMPDGGMAEDFLHVAGLVQLSVGNGTMRPFVLVGIENTERRRDMRGRSGTGKSLYLASSDEPEIATLTRRLAGVLETEAPAGLAWHYEPMPEEKHSTIYHPAALRAFRALFKPAGGR